MYALYSAMLALALAAYSPFFFLRRFGRGGYGHDFRQRLGRVEPGLPAEPRCWIHAVSVGEAAGAAPRVRGIRGRWPALGIVVTSATVAGGGGNCVTGTAGNVVDRLSCGLGSLVAGYEGRDHRKLRPRLVQNVGASPAADDQCPGEVTRSQQVGLEHLRPRSPPFEGPTR